MSAARPRRWRNVLIAAAILAVIVLLPMAGAWLELLLRGGAQ